MLVKNYMTQHPIMIEPQMRIYEAQKLMTDNKVRHLPVIGEGKRLLGLITRQRLQIQPDKLGSLEVWEITRYLADLRVEKVMVKAIDLHTVSPEATLEQAADLMIRHKVGGLPVVEEGIVMGVISETDLLIQLRELLGANESGWRVTMQIPDRTGEGEKLTGAISAKGCTIMALGSVRTPKHPDHWDMILKVSDCTRDELVAILEGIEDQRLIDIRETGKGL